MQLTMMVYDAVNIESSNPTRNISIGSVKGVDQGKYISGLGKYISGLDFDRSGDEIRDLRVKIHVDLRRLNADDQGVSCSLVVSFHRGPRLPPTCGGIDRDISTARQIRCGASPEVTVQRTSVTPLCSDQPGRVAVALAAAPFVLVSRRQIDPPPKLINGFGGRFTSKRRP